MQFYPREQHCYNWSNTNLPQAVGVKNLVQQEPTPVSERDTCNDNESLE